MTKKIFSLFVSMLLILCAAKCVFADSYALRLIDDADLLYDYEEEALLSKLDEISERQRVDIVVVTVDSVGEYTPQEYADGLFLYHEYGQGADADGILLLVSMEYSDWHISTHGYGINVVTDAGLEYMSECFVNELSAGDYAEAFNTFATLCDEFITQANTGEPYDFNNLPKEDFGFLKNIIIALVAGFAVAFIVTGIMRSKLKSVQSQNTASEYIMLGSMKITDSRDHFLYRHVDRRVKPQKSTSGGSHTHKFSGSSFGGGGGKF